MSVQLWSVYRLFSVVCMIASCLKLSVSGQCWTRFSDMHVFGADRQPSIANEDDCRSSCIHKSSCIGVDWNTVYNSCWIATASADPTKHPDRGVTHWDLNRTCGIDLDECATKQSQCNFTTTTCVNTVGSYQCQCRNGYRTMTSTSCTDIDECSTGQSRCDSTSTTCVNTDGSYECQCRNGYGNKYRNPNYTACRDVDECEREQLCNNSTTICINSDGSYHCKCRTGYKRGNDTTCSDIDECNNDDSECDPISTDCINTIGNYTCRCRNGFTYLSETTCLENRLGLIVGLSVGAFLGVTSLTILLLIFCWKRRKEVNRPQQTESSSVDNGSVDENSINSSNYMPLEVTASDKTRKRMNEFYTPMDKSTLLSAPSKKPKDTVQFATYENVQPSTNAKGLCSIDEVVQPANYENVELAIYENAQR